MRRQISAVLCVLVLSMAAARGEEVYFSVPLSALKITAGRIPDRWNEPENAWRTNYRQMHPRARLDVPGEAYLEYRDREQQAPELVLAIRAEAGADVAGHIELPRRDGSGMDTVAFSVPAASAAATVKADFLKAKLAYNQRLTEQGTPGAAWFRHQANAVRKELGEDAAQANLNRNFRQQTDIEDTFGILSGGRALSENLQLDRQLRLNPAGSNAAVDISTIEGIKVKAFDWAPLVKDLHPQADPLARLIPADQHAVFFPTFSAAVTLIDEADALGTPLLEMADPRSEDAGSKQRYQRQLCLSLTGLGRLLGPQVIHSVAVTGSDAYLRVGSDVAVLFEPANAQALRNLLEAQIGLARQAAGAEAVQGEVDGVAYTGARTPDRSACSYLASVGDAIVVTNSLAQLQRLISAQKGTIPALASAPEYTFFRNRYPRGQADETALIILSDATIRRWCSPRWRIADSRRTRVAAILAEYQARNADAIVKKTAGAAPIATEGSDLGSVQLTPSGVVSAAYGSLDFMTPIVEMPLEKATEAEVAAYGNWRIAYENNWKQYFDPIAVRLSIASGKLAVDMTVMPLINRSEYGPFVEVSAGAKLDPKAGDPHDSMLHIELGLNRDSDRMKELGKLGEGVVRVNVLEWLGNAAGIYVDDDPEYWKALPQRWNQRDEAGLVNLPVAVRAEVSNGLKLAGFLVAMRALVEGVAPAQTLWEAKQHNGQGYTKIGPTDKAEWKRDFPDGLAIYYATMPDALVVSLNEGVIQRALDRNAERAKARLAKEPVSPDARPWIGQNLAATADRRVLEALQPVFARAYMQELQVRSWSNLPILNEWKRLYPDQDPVQVHQRLWGTLLVDPAGGKYVWNEQYQTVESTVLGHPAQPKAPEALPGIFTAFRSAQFGLDFENAGLRARATLERTANP